MKSLAVPLLLSIACSSPPSRQPTTMARPPTPPPDAQVGPGRRDAVVLGVTEKLVLPTEGVTEYSDSEPGFVDISISGDQDQNFIIVGRRGGTTKLTFVFTDGHTTTIEITVVYREAPL